MSEVDKLFRMLQQPLPQGLEIEIIPVQNAVNQQTINTAEDWLEVGNRLFIAGDFAGALASFDKAVEFKPDDHEAWLNRGLALSNLGKYEDAVASYDKAIEIKRDLHQAWYNRGVVLFQLGRYEEAIKSYDKAVDIRPDYDIAWNNRGYVLYELGRYEQAVESFDKAIEFKPDSHEAWNNQGATLSQLGRYEEAIASYDKAVDIKPDKYEAWYNRGLALDDLQRYEEAIKSYDKALEIKPNYHEAWYNRGNALDNLGRYEDAIASYDKAVELKPDYHLTWYRRGIILYYLGRYEEAVASYDKAVEINPDLHQAWDNRGVALGNLGRYEDAIASYNKAIEINPDHHFAWDNLGVALERLGRYEDAIASHDKAVDIKPDFHFAWDNLGVALERLGRYEQALVSFNKAIEIKPDYEEAWQKRGCILDSLERYEEAIASCDKAIEIKPDFHEAWIGRGIAAGNSFSCSPLWSSLSAIAKQNPHLNQRGYEGKLASLEEGLKHCPQETHPEGWGKLHKAIGNAHYYQGRGGSHPRSYWYKAANSYNQALKTLTAADFPEAHLEVLQDLIRVRLDLGDTVKAQELRRRGTDVLHRLLDDCPSPGKKRQLALKFAGFQQLTVDVAVQSGNWCAGLELAEEGKNACLSWLLENYLTPSPLLAKERGGFSRGEVSPTWKDIQQLLNPTTAIVYWHLSPAALHTFILKHDTSSPIVLEKTIHVVIQHDTSSSSILSVEPQFVNPAQRLHEFENWVKEWNEQYADYRKGKKKQVQEDNNWRENLPNLLDELTNILDIHAIIKSIQNPKSKIQNLILVPHRDLHRFPLHALFPDNFTITYLPSAEIGLSLLESSQDKQTTDSPIRLLSVEHPNSRDFPILPHAEIESAAITQLFPNPTPKRIAEKQATNPAVKASLQNGYSIFHFTGHSNYNFHNPKKSALILSGEDVLTLEEICHLSPLDKYQLVSISACETAITGNQTITAEYVGLVSGFLSQGVANVVSTLWSVTDESSSFVMIYFYWQISKGKSPEIALAKATKWLRNLTYRKLERICQILLTKLPQNEKPLRLFIESYKFEISQMNMSKKQQKPFAHHYYWAGFIITGGCKIT